MFLEWMLEDIELSFEPIIFQKSQSLLKDSGPA